MSLIDSSTTSVGVGNYKGVMLCNRPFGGTNVAAKGASSGATGAANANKTEFSAGVVPAPMGANVQISAQVKYDKRPKKDSVLNKHRKWLADLQKTKDRLEMEYIQELEAKEEKKLLFQEHERRMREAACSIMRDAKSTVGETPETDAQAKGDSAGAAADSKPQSKTAPAEMKGGKPSSRPAWAMSEEEAEVRQEEQKLAEEDDLLEFTKGLDFEKYIGDLEVQTMMDRLRKRIGDLEHEVALEDYRNAEGAERAQKREKLKNMGLSEAAINEYVEMRNNPDMEAAKKFMEQEEAAGLQDIHSAKSVAAMLKQAQDKIDKVSKSKNPPKSDVPVVTNEPVIVVHDPEEGSRLNGKNTVSNLPYMNRNPAV